MTRMFQKAGTGAEAAISLTHSSLLTNLTVFMKPPVVNNLVEKIEHTKKMDRGRLQSTELETSYALL